VTSRARQPRSVVGGAAPSDVVRGAGLGAQLLGCSGSSPFSPSPGSRQNAGVGGSGPADPVPGGVCGEPEQVPAEDGHLGREARGRGAADTRPARPSGDSHGLRRRRERARATSSSPRVSAHPRSALSKAAPKKRKGNGLSHSSSPASYSR
jgi:hypothetical protein